MSSLPCGRQPRAGIAAAVTLVLLASGACSSDSARRAPDCPDALVLAEAASMTRFAGPGTDLLDVDFQVDIADLLSGCVVEKGKGGGGPMLTVGVAPVMVVSRGPANTSRTAEFAFFVSVVDAAQTIITKQQFAARAEFAGNQSRVVLREDEPPIAVDFPLSGGRSPYDYQLLVGLQLTPEQLEFNRKRLAATR